MTIDATRLLVLDSAFFDGFLQLIPEFRGYLNRRNMYRNDDHNQRKKSTAGLHGSEAEQYSRLQSGATAFIKWRSRGTLGFFGKMKRVRPHSSPRAAHAHTAWPL